MIFSNSTFEEMRREAESTNNELALAIFKKIENEDDEELIILSKSEKYENEIRYYAVHDINNDILEHFLNGVPD